MGPSNSQENPSASLLTFLDLAYNNLQSALQKPLRSKRRGRYYYRKYLGRPDITKAASEEKRTISTVSGDQKQAMDALFEVGWNSSSSADLLQRDTPPPLRMRNLPPSFFNEPLKSVDSASNCSSSNPLEDLLGPDSPLEELLSSPSWKAIVAHSKSQFSYPQKQNSSKNVDPQTTSFNIPNQGSSFVLEKPSCRFQENSTGTFEIGFDHTGLQSYPMTSNWVLNQEPTELSRFCRSEYHSNVPRPQRLREDSLGIANNCNASVAAMVNELDDSLQNQAIDNPLFHEEIAGISNIVGTQWTDWERGALRPDDDYQERFDFGFSNVYREEWRYF